VVRAVVAAARGVAVHALQVSVLPERVKRECLVLDVLAQIVRLLDLLRVCQVPVLLEHLSHSPIEVIRRVGVVSPQSVQLFVQRQDAISH